jgi:hypothetical protein
MAPFKSSLSRNIGKFTKIFNTASLGNQIQTKLTISGGDVVIPGNGYTYHIFTHPDPTAGSTPEPFNLAVSGTQNIQPFTAEVLIVGGGGGGGSGYYGGGGGGGGVIDGASVTLLDGTYPVTVGNGGVGGLYPPGPSSGNDGGESSFDTVTALGGGYGGSGPGGASKIGSVTGANAGGGAQGYTSGGTSVPISIPGPWNAKGVWQVNQFARGASSLTIYGGDGANPTTGGSPGQEGGKGAQIATFPVSVLGAGIIPLGPLMGPTGDYYAGGGAGNNYPVSQNGGWGGGGPGNPGDVTPAPAHLGGGGGGSGNPRGDGGRGGTGLVVVRYQI